MALPPLPGIASVHPITHKIKPHDGARGHKGQVTWITAALTHMVVVIAVGRQVGKTYTVQFLLPEEAARHKGFYVAAYVAQGHPQASEFYEACLANWSAAGIVSRYRDKGQDRFIELIPFGENRGCKIYFWSGDAEAHRGAAGKTLNRLVIDEASLIPEEAYTSTLRPMLNASRGKTLILGSPYPSGIGFDWFQRAWLNVDRDGKPLPADGKLSFNAPSEANPFSSDEWLLEQRKSCRNLVEERCQYDAVFAKDTGEVFSNLDAVFVLPYTERRGWFVGEEYVMGEAYVIGLDFGKYGFAGGDFTVLSVFHANTRRQVALMRISGEYQHQFGLLVEMIDAYGAPLVYADAREGGSVVVEMLRRKYGKSILPVKWSRGGVWDKESAVMRGQDLCQRSSLDRAKHDGWQLLNVPQQREEFRLYSSKPISDTNPTRTYSAPPGRNDDFVAAALMSAYGFPIEDYHFKNATRQQREVIPWTEDWLRAVRRSQGCLPRRNPFSLS